MVKLGEVQKQVLSSLEHFGSWYSGFGCGWMWDTPSGTKRIMDSLVKKGVARVVKTNNKTIYYPVKDREPEDFHPIKCTCKNPRVKFKKYMFGQSRPSAYKAICKKCGKLHSWHESLWQATSILGEKADEIHTN